MRIEMQSIPITSSLASRTERIIGSVVNQVSMRRYSVFIPDCKALWIRRTAASVLLIILSLRNL